MRSSKSAQSRLKHGCWGQDLVEFALVLPLLLVLIFGIIEFGVLLLTYSQTSNQLRAALRYGAIPGQNEANPQYLQCDQMEGIAEEVFFARSQIVTIQYLKPGATSPITCTTGLSPSDIDSGDLLHIRVQTTVDTLTPIISAIYPSLTFNLEGQRTIVKQINP